MSIDLLIKKAEKVALETGYDQIIFMSKKDEPILDRLCNHSFKNTKWVVCYVRVTYRDKKLGTRLEKGGYNYVKRRNMRQTA